MLLGVDPGIRQCGAALFRGGVLHRAAVVKNPRRSGHGVVEALSMAMEVNRWASAMAGQAVSSLVAERMKIYPNGKSPGDPNVCLFPLLGVQHALAGLFHGAAQFEYLPRDWKGSVDGVACTLTVRERLTAVEFERVELPASACPACRTHRNAAYCAKGVAGCGADHVYDAVGLGLKHLNRLERIRVYPR